MKSLVTFLCLCSFFLFVGCSDDDVNQGSPNPSGLGQDDIKLKIAKYYSSPSLATQSVATIQTAFNEKFPNATDVEWKVSNEVYEIDFEINQIDYEAWYDSNANLLMYKHDIANNELAPAVSSAIAKDYPGYVLDEAEKVYKGNIIGFYVDLKKKKEEINAFYKEDGTFISKYLWEDDSVKPGNDAGSTTPEIGGNLSDDEVDALIAAYYSGYDTDVPTSQVPTVISGNFKNVFSNARDIDWETSANIYKVDFEINNVDYEAWYNQDGTLLAYKFDITRASLPASVKNAISSKFAGYKIDDAEKVIKNNSNGYLVELENRNVEEDAYFGEDGTYISNSFYTKNSGSGNNPGAPETPEIPIDETYTDNEIDALLSAYHKGKDVDVHPSKVPAPIITAFNNQFASALDIDWEHVDKVYNVDFEINNVDYEAWYVSNGVLLMYTQEIRYTSVSEAVKNAISSQYSEYMIDGSEYFQKGSIKGYIIELENKRTDAELVVMYKEDGTFIHQQND